MKTRIAMMGLVVAMVLLAGCDGTKKGSSVDPFLGGTNGILMSFMEDAPPVEVYDGGEFPFSIVVTVKNDGEWDVPAGKATLSIEGISPVDFGVTDEDMVQVTAEDLDASSKDAQGNVIPGTVLLMEFPEMAYGDSLVGNTNFPIWASVCYEYGTQATSNLCVLKKEAGAPSDETICVVNEGKTVYSSGAPVAITSFDEQFVGKGKVSFSFTISHKNNGDLNKIGSGCEGGFTDRNKIYVTVDSGLEGLKCSGLLEGDDTSGYVRLSTEAGAGERVVSCVQTVDSATSFIQPVNIRLTYDYKAHIATELLVKHAGE